MKEHLNVVGVIILGECFCESTAGELFLEVPEKQSGSSHRAGRSSFEHHTALNAARQPKTARNLTIMKEQNSEEEVMKILDDIPNGRRALLENYDNLLNVAEYCNNNYTQVLLLQPTDGVACFTSNQLCATKPDFPVTSTTLT